MQQLTATELAAWLNDPNRPQPLLLDVREGWEIAQCALPGITHIPMQEIPLRQQELDPDTPTVVICHHGMRSYQVGLFLERNNGFAQLFNLSGGVAAWAEQVDPAFPRY